MHESKLNHGVSSISEKFIVNGESSEILQLREGPFNNPSLGEYLKFGRTFIRPEHNLHNPPEIIAAPVAKRPPAATIGKNLLKAGKFCSAVSQSPAEHLYCHGDRLHAQRLPSAVQVYQLQRVAFCL